MTIASRRAPLLFVVLGALAPAASGRQVVDPSAGAAPTLRRVEGLLKTVDQGIADRSLLSRSLKLADLGAELRRDTDWERLYEVQTRDGRRRYFRYSNGLSASFNQSEFAMTEDGELTVTPAGTIFHIGRSVDEMAALAGAQGDVPVPIPSQLRLNGRFDPEAAALAAPRMTTTSRAAPAMATVMTDELYRQRRVQGLLRRVAAPLAAEPSSSAPPDPLSPPRAAQR